MRWSSLLPCTARIVRMNARFRFLKACGCEAGGARLEITWLVDPGVSWPVQLYQGLAQGFGTQGLGKGSRNGWTLRATSSLSRLFSKV